MFKTMLLALATVALSTVASAGVLISNLPSNDSTFSTIAASSGLFSKAAGFTMPAGQGYSLDSVTLRLRVNDVSATMTLGLYGNSGGNPVGPELVSFDIPVLALGLADITFFPSAALTLQQSTTYWIVGTGSSPTANGIQWMASAPGVTPTGLATSAGYRFNNSGGFPPTGSSSTLNSYLVNGTAVSQVPEPSTIVLGSMGIAGLLLVRTSRRK